MAVLDNLNFAYPEIFLGLFAMAMLMIGVFNSNRPNIAKNIFRLSAIGFALTIVILCWVRHDILSIDDNAAEFRINLFNAGFIFDNFSYFAKMLIAGIAFCIAIIGLNTSTYAGTNKNVFEFPVLLTLSVLGMFVLVSANDLMTFYIGLELQSLAAYVLVAINRDSERSTESGVKYFVLGALASGIILFGASFIYGFSGTTNLADIYEIFRTSQNISEISQGLIFGFVLLFAGVFFKLSAVPMHMWAPDVYEGSTKTVVAIISTAPKVAAIAFFIRLVTYISPEIYPAFSKIVVIVSALSMIVGSLAALRQNSFKRLLAYSSIANMGYMLIAVAVGTTAAIQAGLIYMIVYMVASVGVFAILAVLKKNGEEIENISEIAGMAKLHPAHAVMFAIFMFSIAGIPPLAGFFGKFFIFREAIAANLMTLSIIGVVTSVIACYYYLKIIKTMYFDDAGNVKSMISEEAGLSIKLVMIASTIFTVGMIFFADNILALVTNATLSLS